jgi:hypothetical protein
MTIHSRTHRRPPREAPDAGRTDGGVGLRFARKRPGARYLPVGFRSPACASEREATAASARRCIAHERVDELPERQAR